MQALNTHNTVKNCWVPPGAAKSLEATRETDMLLYEEYKKQGYNARLEGKSAKNCPGDPNSLVGRWWLEGYYEAKALQYRSQFS